MSDMIYQLSVILPIIGANKAVAVRCSTEPESLTERLRRNSSGPKLSDQLWRAAFGNQISPTGNTVTGNHQFDYV